MAHSPVLSIIIPAYNEAATIGRVLESVRQVTLSGDCRKEVIVIDDASTDGTAAEVQQYAIAHDDLSIVCLTHTTNQGKGAAIHTGIAKATGDYVIIQDADLEYDPREYNKLLQPVLEGHADVVFGSRFAGSNPHRILFFWHSIGNKLLTFFSNMLSNLNLTDMENGYKLFRREIIQGIVLEEKRFGFEPEVTARIARLPDIRIYEVGVSYYGRTYKEGKKINWRDGFHAIWCIMKYNWWGRTAVANNTATAAAIVPAQKNTPAYLLIGIFFVAMLLLAFLAKGTADEGDSVMHYLYARHAFQYPEHFFYHWAKPLYVLIAAPFAQAGFMGVKLMNILASTLALWLAWKTALHLQIRNAWFTILAMMLSPMLAIITLSGLTEPLFALVLIAGIYALMLKRHITGTLLLSFIPFIRSEGLIILCVVFLYFIVKKLYRYIPLLAAGHLVYAVAGYPIHKDFLWIFNKMSYATLSSAYGKGEWLHFVKHLPDVIALPLTVMLVLGLLVGLGLFLRKYLTREAMVSEAEIWLVYGSFTAFFIGHTAFWALGIFNSFGLIRVMVGVLPLMGIICNRAFNLFVPPGKSILGTRVKYGIIGLLLLFTFVLSKYAFSWKRDFTLKADQEAEQRLGDFVKQQYPDYKKTVFYYEPCYLSVTLDIDYFDTSRHKRLLNAFEENKFPDKCFVIWDDWFAVVEGHVELKKIEEDPRFEFIKSFEQADYWGKIRQVRLYRKK
jgi:glycosyltransferase involved in cell wall biosynthesis